MQDLAKYTQNLMAVRGFVNLPSASPASPRVAAAARTVRHPGRRSGPGTHHREPRGARRRPRRRTAAAVRTMRNE